MNKHYCITAVLRLSRGELFPGVVVTTKYTGDKTNEKLSRKHGTFDKWSECECTCVCVCERERESVCEY